MEPTFGTDSDASLEIAIIGMAGRFPGAADVRALWSNLRDGVDSIASFTDDDLRAAGVPDAWLADPGYVRAGGVLDGAERFDAGLFGCSPAEATAMDPQHRLFLECAWEALESAGYAPGAARGRVGVFAGSGTNTYLLLNLLANRAAFAGGAAMSAAVIANDKDYLATRVAYKLDLRGPAVTVQSACSTSLVAVHVACQSLLGGDCDAALAGGVTVRFPQRAGYRHEPGGILSPDGRCRTFDARAGGIVTGDGVGVVLLKRLDDALADGDPVLAVIKGSAVNNDGAHKVGFTAPSIDGQAAVIRAALRAAGVSPASVSYVEAHGTGTALGDPIEVAALRQAFGGAARCALGSLKTNVGHLDTAAGVAGLIKVVLALRHRELPPSLHFERPNPEIDFGPFHVSTSLAPWHVGGGAPRRAGVSSFGIGGTNAHVVVEEAPPAAPSPPARGWQLLVLSARSGAAAARAADRLAAHLRAEPGENLADVAYTLQVGRRAFEHRRAVVCRDAADAVAALGGGDGPRLLAGRAPDPGRPVVFMFPGQGSQYPDMGRGLYETEPVYREEVDRCAALLAAPLGLDVRAALAAPLRDTWVTQPALFVVEYALARLWMSWGVRPAALIGYSFGELVAACLAGVFSLEDALALIVARARAMQALPRGAMLSVALPAEQVAARIEGEPLSIAAINGPALTVLSGPDDAIARLRERLVAGGVACRVLQTSHAFHSAMMDAAAEPFARAVAAAARRPAELPVLSTVTGGWLAPGALGDPDYWARHTRAPIRFGDAVATLLAEHDAALLEVGPGDVLCTLARHARGPGGGVTAVPSMRRPDDARPDVAALLGALGALWVAGATIDGAARFAAQRRARVPLPTYPFERQRYWLGGAGLSLVGGAVDEAPARSTPPPEQGARVPRRPVVPRAAAPGGGRHPRPELPTPYCAPSSDAEAAIAGVWEELLGLERVGVHDNFFDLGGHSLLGVQLAARLNAAFALALPVRAFFEAPTVADLAVVVETALIAQLEALEDPGPEGGGQP